jgi:hypothetical protein
MPVVRRYEIKQMINNAEKDTANAIRVNDTQTSKEMLDRQELKHRLANQEGTEKYEANKIKKNGTKSNTPHTDTGMSITNIPINQNNINRPGRTYKINGTPYEPPGQKQNNTIRRGRKYSPLGGGTRFNKRTRNNKKINKTRRRNKNRTRGLRR